jgi:hypothetical protein
MTFARADGPCFLLLQNFVYMTPSSLRKHSHPSWLFSLFIRRGRNEMLWREPFLLGLIACLLEFVKTWGNLIIINVLHPTCSSQRTA